MERDEQTETYRTYRIESYWSEGGNKGGVPFKAGWYADTFDHKATLVFSFVSHERDIAIAWCKSEIDKIFASHANELGESWRPPT